MQVRCCMTHCDCVWLIVDSWLWCQSHVVWPHCHCISLMCCMTHNSCHAGHVLYDPLWLSCRSCVVWPIVTAPHPWSATVCHTYVCVTHFDWSHLCVVWPIASMCHSHYAFCGPLWRCHTHVFYDPLWLSLSSCVIWHIVAVTYSSCVVWHIVTPTLVKCALWPIVPVTHSCVLWYIVFCDTLWLTHLCSSSVTYCDCNTLVCSRIHCDCDTLILCFMTHCDRLSCIATDTHVFCLWPIMIVTRSWCVLWPVVMMTCSVCILWPVMAVCHTRLSVGHMVLGG